MHNKSKTYFQQFLQIHKKLCDNQFQQLPFLDVKVLQIFVHGL